MAFSLWCGQVTATFTALVLFHSLKYVYKKFIRGKK